LLIIIVQQMVNSHTTQFSTMLENFSFGRQLVQNYFSMILKTVPYTGLAIIVRNFIHDECHIFLEIGSEGPSNCSNYLQK